MTEQKLASEKSGGDMGETEKKVEETGTAEAPVALSGFLAKVEKTDEELFEACEDCHVAVTAAKFADICAEKPDEAGGCELIGRSLADENTEPADWIKAMVQTAENAQGKAKEEMAGALVELTSYLQKRGSDILKQLEDENSKD